ncbi:metal ABC transporter solute-binding protein, Zn/Mn family [Corynebacterium sp.]|uniref:metal ABC transporter solute-binding protein, Zn/Mn family n=1 Tax=Corynebacterium sp. TaxID=1720 RepID=UPI002A908892|nr:zinc ABC transporter substrate-binding protein [Corynebacterium sp.]MDY5785284.1 zinc ABC transporter substrate-binding protein [Corynebacterium sp.]
MFTRALTRPRLAAVAVTSALALGACSAQGGDTQTTTEASTRTDIVATTIVWADVASSVVGEDVTAIISNSSVDPHEYEPTAADRAAIESAEIVVANGGAYDAALYSAADPSHVISALPLTGPHSHADDEAEHDDEHGDEHADEHGDEHDHDHDAPEHSWYSTETVNRVGQLIAERTNGDTADLDARLAPIKEAVNNLPAARVAQAHPIADALIEESALISATPDAYRAASLSHIEPSGAAVAEFIDAIKDGSVDILIASPQSAPGSEQRIVDAARAAGIPVVEVYETPPNGQNFFDYFASIVEEISRAAR